MARIRSDKPEAYQSETLAEISVAAERTFKGMATIADDRGRLADKPAQINGELWSMRGSHTRDDLEAELAEMVGVDLVCRYVGCDGKRYLHLVKWDQHQKIDRPSKSRLPRCPVHRNEADYCGKHEGECKPIEDSMTLDASSRESREGSRGMQAPANGLDGIAEPVAEASPGDLVLVGAVVEPPSSHDGSEQGKPKSSRHSREPSMQDLGSRTLDRGSRTVDQVPPSAGAVEPRTANVGDIVAAFADGATEAGLKAPPANIRARVGKQARALIAEGWDPGFLVDSARRMGSGEWNDLAVQARKDDAAAKGRTGNQQQNEGQFTRAMERARAREAAT